MEDRPLSFDAKGWTQNYQIILVLVISVATLHLFRTYWRLRHVPGPMCAKVTNVQRVLWVKTGRAHEVHHEMHEKYGEVVRFGPNMVSLANPDWIPTLYPIRPGFIKARIKNDSQLIRGKMDSLLIRNCKGQLLPNSDAIHTTRRRSARSVQHS